MKIVRPIELKDLPQLEQLAQTAGHSMTTLPANRHHLSQLIQQTRQSMEAEVYQPGNETYHFVLEESSSKELLGIAGIAASVGLTTPFYSYRIDEEIHASEDLEKINRMTVLKLCQDYTGYTTLCTLFLKPEADTWENLSLLSRARLLFITEHRDRFADRIMAEIQGVLDEENRSPFWDNLGQHFISMNLNEANYMTGIQDKGFIADLMPRYPIYTRLLPKKARSVIGEYRPDREPVMNILEEEGFSYQGYIDIFDAGPTVEAGTDRLQTLRDSLLLTPSAGQPESDDHYLVANTQLENFRCISAVLDPSRPTLSAASIHELQLETSDPVRVVPH